MMGHQPLKPGANSGIGEGVARSLAAAGADVVINYVSRPGGMTLYPEFARGD